MNPTSPNYDHPLFAYQDFSFSIDKEFSLETNSYSSEEPLSNSLEEESLISNSKKRKGDFDDENLMNQPLTTSQNFSNFTPFGTSLEGFSFSDIEADSCEFKDGNINFAEEIPEVRSPQKKQKRGEKFDSNSFSENQNFSLTSELVDYSSDLSDNPFYHVFQEEDSIFNTEKTDTNSNSSNLMHIPFVNSQNSPSLIPSYNHSTSLYSQENFSANSLGNSPFCHSVTHSIPAAPSGFSREQSSQIPTTIPVYYPQGSWFNNPSINLPFFNNTNIMPMTAPLMFLAGRVTQGFGSKAPILENANCIYEGQLKKKIQNLMQPALPVIRQLNEIYKDICRAFGEGIFPPKPEGLNQELMPYQWLGYKWMEVLYQFGIGGCLADGMGLGKTIQSIACIQAVINQKQQEGITPRILISCPANLIDNWIRELKVNCPGLNENVAVLRGKTEIVDSFIYLISHQQLRLLSSKKSKDKSPYVFNQEWNLIIMDEFHNFLNSKNSKESVELLRQKSRGAGHGFIALTGTPMPNNLVELYKLNKMLNPDVYSNFNEFNYLITESEKILRSILFQARYHRGKIPEEFLITQMEKYIVQLIEVLITPFLLRRENSCEEFKVQTAIMQSKGSSVIQPLFPLESELKIVYPFTELQFQLTQGIINSRGRISDNVSEQGALSLFNAKEKKEKDDDTCLNLQDYICLQQIANHPRTLLASNGLINYINRIHPSFIQSIEESSVNYAEPGKLQTIIELVKTILVKNPRDKILIFTNYEQMGHLICTGLKESNFTPTIKKVQFLYGEVKKKNRSIMINSFRKRKGPPVLVAGRKLGSVGWNCVSANHVVIVDPWWNPSDDDQCIGRLHRIGQKKPVHVYRLHSDNSMIDGKMEKLRMEKKAWCELILAGNTTNIKEKIQEILEKIVSQ